MIQPESAVTVTALYIYPVKSCAPIALGKALCLASGLQGDRLWAVAGETGRVLTQRDNRRMSLIQPHLVAEGQLVLSAPQMPDLTVTPCTTTSMSIEKWGEQIAVADQGEEAARWLSSFLGLPSRLVRLPQTPAPDDHRVKDAAPFSSADRFPTTPPSSSAPAHSSLAPIDPSPATVHSAPAVAANLLADCAPLLVILEETLRDLNTRLSAPVAMSRFRPSIVISGLPAYSEHTIGSLNNGQLSLASGKPCGRCVMINIDQESALDTSPEPLKTLATYRTTNNKVILGHYFKPLTPGTLRVGSTLHCHATSAPATAFS